MIIEGRAPCHLLDDLLRLPAPSFPETIVDIGPEFEADLQLFHRSQSAARAAEPWALVVVEEEHAA